MLVALQLQFNLLLLQLVFLNFDILFNIIVSHTVFLIPNCLFFVMFIKIFKYLLLYSFLGISFLHFRNREKKFDRMQLYSVLYFFDMACNSRKNISPLPEDKFANANANSKARKINGKLFFIEGKFDRERSPRLRYKTVSQAAIAVKMRQLCDLISYIIYLTNMDYYSVLQLDHLAVILSRFLHNINTHALTKLFQHVQIYSYSYHAQDNNNAEPSTAVVFMHFELNSCSASSSLSS